MEQKLLQLNELLASLGSAAVAFSAGVDSAFLLAAAHQVLGDRIVAFTAVTPANPAREVDEATAFCVERGIRHILFEMDPMEVDGLSRNPRNRCYLCKKHLFNEMKQRAEREGLRYLVEGSNADDANNYRPGSQALKELGIRSPLQECGFSKSEIRALSREMGLPQWNKPSFACLYTRFPYDSLITPEKVRRVDASEQLLLDLGFSSVRVRSLGENGDRACIEVAADQVSALAESPTRERVVSRLKALGFTSVALDLQGYRTGSMDE